MSAEYTNNHYVPQWYQRQFIPAHQTDRVLYLRDLKPASFRDGRGTRRQRKALRRTGTRHCFASDDLYTPRFGGMESRELERVFFGKVDTHGKEAVEFFAEFDHDRVSGDALENLMMYMSTQKLRTPKGLDWLVAQAGVRDRGDVLYHLTTLRRVYGAIWAECVWQIADAAGSPTKFIVSDHPVTVYNRSCAPGHPSCKGAHDPDIRLQATHTLFPLSSERLLILTNRSWACNPRQPPVQPRANPDLFRGAMFNFLEMQTHRALSEQDVLKINCIIKRRAYRSSQPAGRNGCTPSATSSSTGPRSATSTCLCPIRGRSTQAPRSSSATPAAAPKRWTPSADAPATAGSDTSPKRTRGPGASTVVRRVRATVRPEATRRAVGGPKPRTSNVSLSDSGPVAATLCMLPCPLRRATSPGKSGHAAGPTTSSRKEVQLRKHGFGAGAPARQCAMPAHATLGQQPRGRSSR